MSRLRSVRPAVSVRCAIQSKGSDLVSSSASVADRHARRRRRMRRRPYAKDARSDLLPEVVRRSTALEEGRVEHIAARAPPADSSHGGVVAARYLDYDLGLAFTQPLHDVFAPTRTLVA